MTPQPAQAVVLITGASSGIGRACAELMSREGYLVYGTSRQPQDGDLPFTMISMDVTDEISIKAGIQQVLSQVSRLDVLINNAGYGIAGALEETSPAELQAQLDTNFLGVFRLCHEILPLMRAQGSGHIITISSIGGLIGLPFQGAYSASKFALEGLMEALRMEVKAFGIQVSLVEPGDFHTAFTDRRIKTAASQSDSSYAAQFSRTLEIIQRDERQGPAPDRIARQVLSIIQDPAPGLRHVVGSPLERLAVQLKKILPAGLFEWAIRKSYGL